MLRVVSTVYLLLQKTQQNVKMISFNLSDQLSHLKKAKKKSGMYRPTVRDLAVFGTFMKLN
jgi:hypothetical protein